MTIVVFRDGVMAADSLATNHHNARVGKIRKLARRDSDGALAGVAGFAGDCTDFLAWFLRNKEAQSWKGADEENGFSGLVAFPDGRVVGCDVSGRFYGIDAPFHARGSAQAMAMGALAMGASAEEAVKACIDFDIHCGGPVQRERHRK